MSKRGVHGAARPSAVDPLGEGDASEELAVAALVSGDGILVLHEEPIVLLDEKARRSSMVGSIGSCIRAGWR
jgi:hypothetical protein